MRIIKFRACDKKDKEMMMVAEMILNIRGVLKVKLASPPPKVKVVERWAKDVVLMQYTGFKDKNGREIYEGDIVYDAMKRKKIVFYDEYGGEFMLKDPSGVEYDFASKDMAKDWEVIGNICENPELLKVENRKEGK